MSLLSSKIGRGRGTFVNRENKSNTFNFPGDPYTRLMRYINVSKFKVKGSYLDHRFYHTVKIKGFWNVVPSV